MVKQSFLSIVGTKIARSGYLGILQAQRIRQNRRKTGFTVFRIVWHGPQMSQIAWPRLSTTPTASHVLSAHAHNC